MILPSQWKCDSIYAKVTCYWSHDRTGQWVREIFYGHLEDILVCSLPDINFWGSKLRSTTHLLALITPCVTGGKDAGLELTLYHRIMTAIITDLHVISAVVGRVETCRKWGIIDRTGEDIQAEFFGSVDRSESEED